eukprot:sb/3462034/
MFQTTAKSELFKGYVFEISSNIPHKIARNIQHQIIANGGGCRSEVEIEFFVVDPFKPSPPLHKTKTHVTYMWLQRCIQASQIVSLSSHTLYSPSPVPEKCEVFKNCVICYTQFSGYELAHVCEVIKVLGGTPQGVFTKKPIKGKDSKRDCLPCTHLVYKDEVNRPTSKVLAARNWGIPFLQVGWLYQCLSTLSLVDPDTFHYEKENENGDKHHPYHKKPEPITKTASKAATVLLSEMPTGTKEVRVTAESVSIKQDKDGFATPIKIKNSRLKVDSVVEMLDSPAVTSNNDTTLGSLPTMFKRNISNAAGKTRVLAGVTLVIKQRPTEVPLVELKAMARKNGAVTKNYLDRTTTHIICAPKDNYMETALKEGKKVVSCYWLVACNEQGQRLPESEFPPGYDPKRTLNLSVSEDKPVEAVDIDNTALLDPPPSHLPPATVPSPITTAISPTTAANNSEEDPYSLDANLLQEIALMQKIVPASSEGDEKGNSGLVAPGTPRRIKRSAIRRINSMPVPEEQLMSQAPPAATFLLICSNPPFTFVSLAHETESMTYEDGQAARAEFLARKEEEDKTRDLESRDQESRDNQMSRDCPPNDTLISTNPPRGAPSSASTPTREQKQMNSLQVREMIGDINPDDLDFSLSDQDTTIVDEDKPTRNFMLSAMTETEKNEFPALLAVLGGTYLPSSNFDKRCTHLVARKPSRNEKYLSAIAAGCRILHPSYIEACREKGEWLDETQYTLDKFSDNYEGKDKNLAKASGKWRDQKAFDGWRVILCCSESKIKNFKGIITAGGGVVIQEKPPFSVLTGTTHALVDTRCSNKHGRFLSEHWPDPLFSILSNRERARTVVRALA